MNIFSHLVSFIHPIIVHFPIALLATTVILEVLYLFMKKESLKTASWYTLLIGVIFAYVAIATGPDHVRSSLVDYHSTAAWITTLLFSAALVWRYAQAHIAYFAKFKLRYLYILLILLGFISLSVTGYLGGAMVYEHGVGVVQQSSNQ